MKKMSDFGTGFSKKVERFLRQNAYTMTIGLVLFFMYVFFKFGSLYDKNVELLNMVKRDLGSVIFLTPAGQVVKMKKSPVNYADMRIANYIANTIDDLLIKDLTYISKGFKKQYASAEDLFKNVDSFVKFYKIFDDTGYAKTFSKYIFKMILEDELPENITIYDKRVESYNVYKEGGKNVFEIKYIVKMVTRQWLKELPQQNKWVTKKVSSTIRAKGYFDIMRYGSVENPFGVRIDIKELPIPTKRKE